MYRGSHHAIGAVGKMFRKKAFREYAFRIEIGATALPILLLVAQVSEGKGRVGA